MNPYEIPFDKVVSSEEEQRIEDLSIAQGQDPRLYNKRAGEQVAYALDRYIKNTIFTQWFTALLEKAITEKMGLRLCKL